MTKQSTGTQTTFEFELHQEEQNMFNGISTNNMIFFIIILAYVLYILGTVIF